MAKYQVSLLSNTIITSDFSPQKLINTILEGRNLGNSVNFLNTQDPQSLTISDFKLDPEALSQILTRLKMAITKKEGILIYGDYDVDGITSTAILYNTLIKLKANVLPFIPHRHVDGYGLKHNAVKRYLAEKKFNAKLIITVDNGISAKAEIKKLQTDGLEIIVTDHHERGLAVPDNCLILHTTETSGAGISWFLANQLLPGQILDIAVLGIVADCLPVLGLNRTLVAQGLKDISQTRNRGLKKLIEISGISEKNIDTYHLSFLLAPRLNASGRLDDATNSLRLLCTNNEEQANNYSQLLNDQNFARQKLQQESLTLALIKVSQNQSKLLLVSDKSFNPGIIGLIAGKLTETYYRPSIVISQQGEIFKGSCRSIPELNITKCLEECRDLCLDLGGHSMAAGFSLLPENFNQFCQRITQIIDLQLSGLNLIPKILADAKMELSAINLPLCQAVASLAPFGIGFPEPTFYFENIKINDRKVLGSSQNHLKLFLDSNLEALIFSADKEYFQIKTQDTFSFVAKLSQNTFNNFTKPQLLVKYISSVNGRSL